MPIVGHVLSHPCAAGTLGIKTLVYRGKPHGTNSVFHRSKQAVDMDKETDIGMHIGMNIDMIIGSEIGIRTEHTAKTRCRTTPQRTARRPAWSRQRHRREVALQKKTTAQPQTPTIDTTAETLGMRLNHPLYLPTTVPFGYARKRTRPAHHRNRDESPER